MPRRMYHVSRCIFIVFFVQTCYGRLDIFDKESCLFTDKIGTDIFNVSTILGYGSNVSLFKDRDVIKEIEWDDGGWYADAKDDLDTDSMNAEIDKYRKSLSIKFPRSNVTFVLQNGKFKIKAKCMVNKDAYDKNMELKWMNVITRESQRQDDNVKLIEIKSWDGNYTFETSFDENGDPEMQFELLKQTAETQIVDVFEPNWKYCLDGWMWKNHSIEKRHNVKYMVADFKMGERNKTRCPKDSDASTCPPESPRRDFQICAYSSKVGGEKHMQCGSRPKMCKKRGFCERGFYLKNGQDECEIIPGGNYSINRKIIRDIPTNNKLFQHLKSRANKNHIVSDNILDFFEDTSTSGKWIVYISMNNAMYDFGIDNITNFITKNITTQVSVSHYFDFLGLSTSNRRRLLSGIKSRDTSKLILNILETSTIGDGDVSTQTEAATPRECPKGQELNRNESIDVNCSNCLPGFFKNLSGSLPCEPCPIGSFSEVRGALSCISCNPPRTPDKFEVINYNTQNNKLDMDKPFVLTLGQEVSIDWKKTYPSHPFGLCTTQEGVCTFPNASGTQNIDMSSNAITTILINSAEIPLYYRCKLDHDLIGVRVKFQNSSHLLTTRTNATKSSEECYSNFLETSSSTPEPTASSSSTPEPTASSSSTPEPTASSSSTPEPTPSSSSTPEPTASSSSTPEPTASSSSTPEPTASSSSTPEPTASSSSTPEPTASSSSTPPPDSNNIIKMSLTFKYIDYSTNNFRTNVRNGIAKTVSVGVEFVKILGIKEATTQRRRILQTDVAINTLMEVDIAIYKPDSSEKTIEELLLSLDENVLTKNLKDFNISTAVITSQPEITTNPNVDSQLSTAVPTSSSETTAEKKVKTVTIEGTSNKTTFTKTTTFWFLLVLLVVLFLMVILMFYLHQYTSLNLFQYTKPDTKGDSKPVYKPVYAIV